MIQVVTSQSVVQIHKTVGRKSISMPKRRPNLRKQKSHDTMIPTAWEHTWLSMTPMERSAQPEETNAENVPAVQSHTHPAASNNLHPSPSVTEDLPITAQPHPLRHP